MRDQYKLLQRFIYMLERFHQVAHAGEIVGRKIIWNLFCNPVHKEPGQTKTSVKYFVKCYKIQSDW